MLSRFAKQVRKQAAMTKLRIGTRGSPLALKQAEAVRAALAKANRIAVTDIEIVALKTTGDIERDRSFEESGGKGIFTK